MKLQQLVEEKVGFLIVFTFITISIGLLVQVIPLFFTKEVITATEGVKPYSPLQVVGRDIYVREGCYNCHSQQIRPFRAETERYGHYSVAGESVYDHPFQWGSKRTGPDLARVGGRYSDEWHRIHLLNPRGNNRGSYESLATCRRALYRRGFRKSSRRIERQIRVGCRDCLFARLGFSIEKQKVRHHGHDLGTGVFHCLRICQFCNGAVDCIQPPQQGQL